MIQRTASILFVFVLLGGFGMVFPERSEALYCGAVQILGNEMICTTVEPFQPDSSLILCQFLSSSFLVNRGEIDYGACRLRSNEKIWECNRDVPRNLPPVTLTESEWNNVFIRYSKVCGDCPSGWK
jgi:hypothetical protein